MAAKTEQTWPDTLWLVRHGQSAGNVQRDAAEAAALPIIDLDTRDVDTPLSPLGSEQSIRLGQWFATLPKKEQPNVVLFSPHVRARETALLIIEHGGLSDAKLVRAHDERLREKEFGILDRLTKFGIEQKHPELHAQRSDVGKFYFRPPGGESWCDAILRLRSVIDTLNLDYSCDRVLIVAHQVVVNCFRYLLEGMDEKTILDIDRAADVPNCSVTWYAYDADAGHRGKLVLQQANFIAPVADAGTPVTTAPDVPAAKQPGA